ncbi:MAG: GAF domain-containing sensor histidine kinase [Candidatus Solibacter usitatus]|nr:GAF domain-containing sensor histidine kinase [Candidatus Solibacter usitatus]
MSVSGCSPVPADAAGVLNEQLRRHLRHFAKRLAPHGGTVDHAFERRLAKLHYGPRERAALSFLTPGAVAKALTEDSKRSGFFEQVEYYGRRLAKLNLQPGEIIGALGEYDRLLTPLLTKLSPEAKESFRWVREQLHFCVILTLNNAYYQVREAETQAFYELFRGELESRNLHDLSHRFLETLALFCRADGAHLFLAEPGTRVWQRRGSLDKAESIDGAERIVNGALAHRLGKAQCWTWKDKAGPGDVLLDAKWSSRFHTCWSIPLNNGGQLGGVMQFGFRRPYEWLPREQELLMAAAERCWMAAEKARLVDSLAQREDEIRTLAARMLHVEEAERRRISRELHDEAGQSLLTVRLQLEMIEKAMPPAVEPLRVRLSEAREVTEGTIIEIRRLIAALSPAVLEQLGLGAALRQLVSRHRRSYPVRIKLQLTRMQNLPKKSEIIVYRLVQECLNNIAKHSKATHVMISAVSADGMLRLQVEDNGLGFRVDEALEKRGSFGLSGIRERVALMGGTCSISSSTDCQTKNTTKPRHDRARAVGDKKTSAWKGTRIRIELPLGEAASGLRA